MKRGWKIFGFILLGALFIVAVTYVTMLLWNWLVPVLFAGPVITYWQALGLLALSKILFSGKGSWGHRGGCDHNRASAWKNRLSSMSPEERDAFKRKLKDKWCQFDRTDSDEKTGSSNV